MKAFKSEREAYLWAWIAADIKGPTSVWISFKKGSVGIVSALEIAPW